MVLVDNESRCCESTLEVDARTPTVADYLLNTPATDTGSALGSRLGSSNAAVLRKQQLENDSKLTNQ